MSNSIQTTTSLKKIIKLIQENPDKHIYSIVGGMCCSKTFSIMMLLINHCLNAGGTEVIVVSHQLSKAKITVIKDFKFIMQEFGIFNERSFKAETEYTFDNTSVIRFVGADRMDLGKGLRTRGWVFFNEANRLKYETFRQIASRAQKVILDYNADFESYIERRVNILPDTAFLRLTIYDNEMAPENEKREVENYKVMGYNNDGSIKDEFYANLYNVYGLGLTGRAIGAIYTNWKIGEYEEGYNGQEVYGLDFGYSSDPDALVKISVDHKNKEIRVKECLYQNGNSSDELAEVLKNICGKGVIIADCAEDRLIDDLKAKGLNIRRCRKNKIASDIKTIQGYRMIVDENSTNLQYELNNYVWLDKESKSVPIDKNNHLLDSLRYAFNFLQKPVSSCSVVVC